MNFSNRPVLVFWETTRSCLLSCVHCRASAITKPLPGELSTREAYNLIEEVRAFGKPYPTIIFTGGDPLMRNDLFDLLSYASKSGVSFAVSPAVTSLFTNDTIRRLKEVGTTSISISLDASSHEIHDSIRGQLGTFERTIEAISRATQGGLNVQINTTIMKKNFEDLPEIFHLIKSLGVKTWELFFLVKVGRGVSVEDLDPVENESVCNFLYDSSFYGMTIRCVEAPFIRRVVKLRKEKGNYWNDSLYSKLRSRLVELEGLPSPTSTSTLGTRGTLDGDGIVFVGYDGSIYPGGLVPVNLGNVRVNSLANLYQHNELLVSIRDRKLNGQCGSCDFKEMCGGSRARAYSSSNDPLASDRACILVRA